MYSDINSFTVKLKFFYKHTDEKKLDHLFVVKKPWKHFNNVTGKKLK